MHPTVTIYTLQNFLKVPLTFDNSYWFNCCCIYNFFF